MTQAFGDSIIISGGQDLYNNDLDSVELYDHHMNFSRNLPPLLYTRRSHLCSSVGTLVVVSGGSSGSYRVGRQPYPPLSYPLGVSD